MHPGLLTQSGLYGRLTIGNSIDLTVTDSEDNHEFTEQGLYLIVNVGNNPCYAKMAKGAGAGLAATTSDLMITTIPTSGELCHRSVEVGMVDHKVHGNVDRWLRFICDTGKTTTLRVTKLTKK